jgi:hypothetical protein
MGRWFGRKSAPADARPFVPGYASLGLSNGSAEEGFARSVEGMLLYERTSGTWAAFRNAAWELGMVRASALLIGGQQVVGPRAAAIQSATGGTVVDSECRAAIDAILDAMRQHGLIDS